MKISNSLLEIQVYAIFPEAEMAYDNEGQVIIYTGYYDNPGPGENFDQSLGFNPILFQGWIESYFVSDS